MSTARNYKIDFKIYVSKKYKFKILLDTWKFNVYCHHNFKYFPYYIIIGTLHGKVKLTRIYNTHILFCKIINLYSLPVNLLYNNIICIYILYT